MFLDVPSSANHPGFRIDYNFAEDLLVIDGVRVEPSLLVSMMVSPNPDLAMCFRRTADLVEVLTFLRA